MSDILELETFLTLPHREGEIRAGLKDAGNGPAVDVRIYGRKWKKLPDGTWHQLAAAEGLKPTKSGIWIPLEHAEQLADTLPFAILRGYEYRAQGGYPADGGPKETERRPDWDCSECGSPNLAEARNCAKCGIRKRLGVMA